MLFLVFFLLLSSSQIRCSLPSQLVYTLEEPLTADFISSLPKDVSVSLSLGPYISATDLTAPNCQDRLAFVDAETNNTLTFWQENDCSVGFETRFWVRVTSATEGQYLRILILIGDEAVARSSPITFSGTFFVLAYEAAACSTNGYAASTFFGENYIRGASDTVASGTTGGSATHTHATYDGTTTAYSTPIAWLEWPPPDPSKMTRNNHNHTYHISISTPLSTTVPFVWMKICEKANRFGPRLDSRSVILFSSLLNATFSGMDPYETLNHNDRFLRAHQSTSSPGTFDGGSVGSSHAHSGNIGIAIDVDSNQYDLRWASSNWENSVNGDHNHFNNIPSFALGSSDSFPAFIELLPFSHNGNVTQNLTVAHEGAIVLVDTSFGVWPYGWEEFTLGRNRFITGVGTGGTPSAIGGSDSHDHSFGIFATDSTGTDFRGYRDGADNYKSVNAHTHDIGPGTMASTSHLPPFKTAFMIRRTPVLPYNISFGYLCEDGNRTHDVDVCSGHGTCFVDNGPCVCDLHWGSSASFCSDFRCVDGILISNASSVCSGGRGNCSVAGGDCTCFDPLYWGGNQCGEMLCEDGNKASDTGIVCSGHGTCSVPGGECECHEQWGSVLCSVFRCADGILVTNSSFVCSGGRGNCSVAGGSCSCFEPEKWTDQNCSSMLCEDGNVADDVGTVCSGHGTCVTPNGVCQCSPSDQWGGLYCSEYYCADGKLIGDGSLCGGGYGNCSGPLATCECYDSSRNPADNCTTWWCVDGELNSDVGTVCSGHGNCVVPGGMCVCDPLWGSPLLNCSSHYCEDGVLSSESGSVCSGHGNCVTPNGTCECSPVGQWGGMDCSDYYCADGNLNNSAGVVCGGHGHCDTPLGVCQCDDPSYHAPSNCTSWWCADGFLNTDVGTVCSGHGSCVVPGGECVCEPFWGSSELNCSVYYCHDGYLVTDTNNVCSGHGNCSVPDGPCQCDPPTIYGGVNCSEYLCADGNLTTDYATVCGGHGTCLYASGPCVCHPSDAWGSEFCGTYKCEDGKLHTDVGNVCSGHGRCMGVKGVCEGHCDVGWGGYLCDSFRCEDDELYDDVTNVCSGHGTCSEGNPSCICPESGAWGGPLCATYKCADLNLVTDEVNVCSGHGTCNLAGGACVCDDGFDGTFCAAASEPEDDSQLTTIIAIATPSAVVGIVLVIAILAIVLICILCAVKRGKNGNDLSASQLELIDNTKARLDINEKLFEIPWQEVELVKEIGSGGSDSTIFEARWKKKKCVFKVYRTVFLTPDNTSFDEFEREVAVMSGINHPNVIHMFGASLSPPRVGIVMELASEGDIHDYLKRREASDDPVSYSNRLRLISEVADGMDYLHCRSIVHRDLKCANVLIDELETVKIIDFGLSRCIEEMNRNLTKRIGTATYMSPEMTLGQPYTGKTDVYSFAILCFEVMEMNFRPFGDVPEDVIPTRVAHEPSFRPEFSGAMKHPTWLRRLIDTSWSHDCEERPSFEEIREVFEKEMGGESDNKDKDGLQSVDEDEGEKEGEVEEVGDRVEEGSDGDMEVPSGEGEGEESMPDDSSNDSSSLSSDSEEVEQD